MIICDNFVVLLSLKDRRNSESDQALLNSLRREETNLREITQYYEEKVASLRRLLRNAEKHLENIQEQRAAGIEIKCKKQ